MKSITNWFRKLPARVKVLAKAAPTWGVIATAVVTGGADQLAQVLPEQSQAIAAWAARITVWIGVGVELVRRLTPAPPEQRGILPPEG